MLFEVFEIQGARFGRNDNGRDLGAPALVRDTDDDGVVYTAAGLGIALGHSDPAETGFGGTHGIGDEAIREQFQQFVSHRLRQQCRAGANRRQGRHVRGCGTVSVDQRPRGIAAVRTA
ncbi:hypothetical protein [Nocardia miyunensis]|uniref:hypothetical protein n=1 Tax=Nocardia miyunensis TaxID=282684 RepID=UPI001FDFD3E2|nr:hypothetical protein [Nocardia miyunensis]